MASSNLHARGGAPVPFLLTLFEQRGIQVKPIPLSISRDHISVHKLDLADLLILTGAEKVLFYSLPPDVILDENIAALIEEVVQTHYHKDRLKLLEYTTATEDGLSIIRQIINMAAFSRSELANIKKTEPLKKYLTRRFISTASLASLNPYTYQGPVTGTRFFGRENELSMLRLQTEKSFVISGMRRSGKTSLMMEFSRRIQLAQASNELLIFVNFETCSTIKDVSSLILSTLVEQLKASANQDLASRSDDIMHLSTSKMWQSPNNIPRLGNTIWKLISSTSGTIRFRFLFDEYDRVVALERHLDFVFTRTWRNLLMKPQISIKGGRSLHGVLQFTFAGSRKLYEEILSEKSPLHNLAARLTLPNFDLQTLTDLVTRPMREIGVVVQDPANVSQTILKATGGHPATTQHLLSLVIADPQAERTHEIAISDIQRAGKNPNFLGLFKNTIEKNVPPLGRFVLAQMAINSRDKVNVHFIRDIARKYQIQFNDSEINVQLEDLADSGYLRAIDFAAGHTVYRLEVPTVPALFSATDVDDLIPEMLTEGVCRRV